MQNKLHHYSCDTADRKLIHVYLTTISILFSYLLFWGSQNTCLNIPWWFDAPAIFGFYGLFYFLFKKSLWKSKVIRKLLNIRTPNWNGIYVCSLNTSYDEFKTETEIKITIIQDWDVILIQTETDNSISNSMSGSFSMNDSSVPRLTYEYLNKPNNQAPDKMNIHYGMSNVWFDSNVLNGEFFNGRGRNNYGLFKENK